MSLKVNIDVKGIEDLQKQIDYVNKMLQMKTDKSFQKYIQERVLETADKVTNDRLKGGTTNDEDIELYKSSHKIREIEGGFELYNDAKIPADKYNVLPFDTSGYPEGMFSIALAFEYGVGVVGEDKGLESGNYKYNDYEHSKSESHRRFQSQWYLPYNVMNESGITTAGYEGFEIYRNIAIEVEKRLKLWVNEYYNQK